MMRPVILPDGNDSERMLGVKRDTDFSVKGIMASQQAFTSHVSSKTSTIKPLLTHDFQTSNNRENPTTPYAFTMKDLQQFLFGKARATDNGRPWDATDEPRKDAHREMKEICSGVCQHKMSDKCTIHGPLQSLRKLVKAQHLKPGTEDKIQLTYAMTSFPPEVQLCESSVPCHCYGVSAQHFIPIGTWIGPYEGIRLNASELRPGTDTSYMWEIYQDGRITSYLDASDENASSWMRFIRCARHKLEQNLFAFQYCGNIYYRAFKDIAPGTELLVWYDNHYDTFLGIPIGLQELNLASIGHLFPQDFDRAVSTFNLSHPPSTHLHPSLTQHCDIVQRPTAITGNDCGDPPAIESLTVLTKSTGTTKETADTNSLNSRSSDSPNSDHLETGIWRCGQCFKSFTQRSLLQIHVCPHLPEKPYQCGHCAQFFSHPTDLRTHVVTHNSERPFKCGFCGRSFAGSTTLNNHIRTHTGEKPFVCEKCGRPFSQASQLSRHQRLPGDCHGNNVY